VDLVDLLTDPATAGLHKLDVSMLPELRAIRRAGPGRVRRAALLAVLHLGGSQAIQDRL
jgi:hypothetical protein